MNRSQPHHLMPYYRNGRLYLPEPTSELLIRAGLDGRVGRAAIRGLDMDEQRDWIALIEQTVRGALARLDDHSPEYQALNSPEARFLLTGRRLALQLEWRR